MVMEEKLLPQYKHQEQHVHRHYSSSSLLNETEVLMDCRLIMYDVIYFDAALATV